MAPYLRSAIHKWDMNRRGDLSVPVFWWSNREQVTVSCLFDDVGPLLILANTPIDGI